jgi:plastocyanin
MKKIVTAIALLLTGTMFSYAQCDKTVLLTGSKTEFLDGDSTVQKTVDEKTTIVFDKASITVKPGDNTMTGTITSNTCNWTTPFKTGKTVLKAALQGGNGETENITITIEGKDGKISFHATQDNRAGRIIRLAVDQFEEQKN